MTVNFYINESLDCDAAYDFDLGQDRMRSPFYDIDFFYVSVSNFNSKRNFSLYIYSKNSYYNVGCGVSFGSVGHELEYTKMPIALPSMLTLANIGMKNL